MPTDPAEADAETRADPDPEPAADARVADARAADEPRRPPRRGRLAVALLVAAAAAVWFAPGVLGRTSLRHTVLHRLAPDFPGDVTIAEADLGWLSPAVFRGVRVTNPGGGEPVLTVEELRTSRPLGELLAAAWGGDGPADFGAITLVRPVLAVAVRPGGSDMEDLLAPVLEGDSGGGAAGFAVVVEDGAATFTDPAGGVTAVSGLNATVRVPAGAAIPETAELTADFGDGERSGAVAASLAAGGEFTLRADGVPLAAAGPLAVRFGTDDPAAAWSLGGAADADLAGTLAAAGGTVSGAVRGARVVARNAAWPVGDRVTLETAELDGGVAWRDGGLVADRLRFASAPLTVTADGPLPLSVPADPAALLDADRRVGGTADLPALAAMLPGRLGLRDGVRVEAGALAFAAAIDAGDESGTRSLTATADVAGLRAAVPAAAGGGTRTVTPDGPVSLSLAATAAGDALTVDRLTAEADGVTVAGRGRRTTSPRTCGRTSPRSTARSAGCSPSAAASPGR